MRRNLLTVALAGVLFVGGCRGGDDVTVPADAVATVGSQTLTRDELQRNIPSGLSADDSTALARAYVRDWIDQRLIEQVAARDVDIEEIDRLTADYRRELIMSRYRHEMARRADTGEFAEDSLRAYYDAHGRDFTLERPLMQGIYLKVADEAPQLRVLRRLYKSDRPVDLDRLEKEAPAAASHYDYFRDRWVDWEQIENRIPADFSAADVAAIAAGQPFELSTGGFTYLLKISDVIPAGHIMPYETARPLVRERMLTARRRAFDMQLRNDLYESALASGQLVVY